MILKVHLHNWKRHQDKEFNFKEGMNLILGPNTSGKTSVMQAIFYALTGDSPERRNLLEFKRAGSDEAQVELSLATNDGYEYLVRRYISGEKRVNENAHLYVSQNGEPAEIASKPDEVNTQLGKILGFGTQFFLRALYLKEGDVYEFLQNPSDKVLQEIDQMLQMDKIKNLVETVKIISREKGKEAKSCKTNLEKVKTPFAKKQGLIRNREELEKQISDFNSQLQELQNQQKNIEDAASLLKRIRETEKKLEEYRERLTRLGSDLKGEGSPKEKIEAAFGATKRELEEQKTKSEEKQSKVLSLQSRIKEYEEKLHKLETATEKCPLCEQKLTPEHVIKIKKDFTETIQKLTKESQNTQKENEAVAAKIQATESRLNDLQSRKIELETILETLKILNDEKSALEKQFPSNQPKSMEKLESSLSQLGTQIKTKQEEIEKVKKEKLRAEVTLEVSTESAAELEKMTRNLVHQEFVISTTLEALERTVKRLREEKLVEVKQRASQLLSRFKPGIWTVNWDEKFVPQITSPERSLSAYQLSGAEKLLLFMVIRLAMASIFGKPDFILLDEPTYHLDMDRSKLVHNILREYLQTTKIRQLIVCSFDPYLEEYDWDNKITLEI